jgi:hypothetical protein
VREAATARTGGQRDAPCAASILVAEGRRADRARVGFCVHAQDFCTVEMAAQESREGAKESSNLAVVDEMTSTLAVEPAKNRERWAMRRHTRVCRRHASAYKTAAHAVS